MPGYCPPPITGTPCYDDCFTAASHTPAQLAEAIDIAKDVLWMATGGKFSRCRITLEGCFGCCESDACTCDPCTRSHLFIPNTSGVMIVSISATNVDTAVVTPITGARVVNGSTIQLARGTSWPEKSIVTVVADIGVGFPKMYESAVVELAGELIKSRCTTCTCNLPKNVVAMQRGDQSYSFISPQDILINGLIGLPLCDLFVRTYGKSKATGVYSPDLMAAESGGCTRWVEISVTAP